MNKQYEMLKTVLHFHKQAIAAIQTGVETADIFKLPVREEIARAKYIPETAEQLEKLKGEKEVEAAEESKEPGKEQETERAEQGRQSIENIAAIRNTIDEQMKKLQTGSARDVKVQSTKAGKE